MSLGRFLRVSETARLAVCSQAPGTRVHESGIPFTDASGDRLRDWMGVSAQEFYDEARIAIIAMGFCFPGQDENGGDLPPRAECSKLWHKSLFDHLPQLELVLAVGSIRSAGISAPKWGQVSRRPCSTGGGTCGADGNPHLAAASPVLAQQWLANAQSVVRGRAAAGAPP